MNIVGGSIGRTAIYNIDDLANINQAVCLIRMFSQYLDEQFFLHFFNSSICVSYMFDKQVDNARANLSMGNISKFVIPLPSLTEQKRIVEKVETLFALCDSMKEKIFKAQELKVLLSKTIVEKAIQ
jgi:type I restriction enzyme S subunit